MLPRSVALAALFASFALAWILIGYWVSLDAAGPASGRARETAANASR